MKILCGALAVFLALLAVPGTAHGAVPADEPAAPIRYAAVTDCSKDPLNAEWCGRWWYRATDGKRHPLREAGRWQGAVGVSGDGRRLAYVRAKDARLVIRDLDGRTRVSRARAWPSKEELDVTRVTMSYDGSLVAVDCCWAGATQHPARVYDADSGALLGKVPGFADALSFSGDGDQVLVRTDDGRLRVHELNGKRAVTDVPPRLVGENGATAALHADGRTVAVYITGRRPKIVLYDLESGRVTDTFPVPPSGQKMERDPVDGRLTEAGTKVRLDWTGDYALRMVRETGFKRVGVKVYSIDAGTGTVSLDRAYSITKTTEQAVSGM